MEPVTGINRHQLMTTSLEQLVDPAAFCRIIDAYVEALELEAFGFNNSNRTNKEQIDR